MRSARLLATATLAPATRTAGGATRGSDLRGGRANRSGRGCRDFLGIQILVVDDRTGFDDRRDGSSSRRSRGTGTTAAAGSSLLTDRSGRTRTATRLLTRVASLIQFNE